MTEREPVDEQSAGPATTAVVNRRRPSPIMIGRTLLTLGVIALLVAVGIGWTIHHRADTAMAAKQVDALFPDDPNIRQGGTEDPASSAVGADTGGTGSAAQPGGTSSGGSTVGTTRAGGNAGPVTPEQAAAKPAENILILGLDTRGNGEHGVGPGTSQSDVIMVAHLHAGHRTMSVLAIPRDLYVSAPTCKSWDNATGVVSDQDFVSPYTSWKITNAYSVGGPRCTVQAVQALTGARMDRLVAIQFDGFKNIVDALGGVEMNFKTSVIDKNQGVVIAQPGRQRVTGDQALKLVRSRIVQGDPTGDLGRINRQHQVISAMMHQMTSTGVFTDPARLDRVVQTFVAHSTVANVSIDQLLDLARTLGGGSVNFTTLPTAAASGSDGLDQTPKDAAIFQALVDDRPLS